MQSKNLIKLCSGAAATQYVWFLIGRFTGFVLSAHTASISSTQSYIKMSVLQIRERTTNKIWHVHHLPDQSITSPAISNCPSPPQPCPSPPRQLLLSPTSTQPPTPTLHLLLPIMFLTSLMSFLVTLCTSHWPSGDPSRPSGDPSNPTNQLI